MSIIDYLITGLTDKSSGRSTGEWNIIMLVLILWVCDIRTKTLIKLTYTFGWLILMNVDTLFSLLNLFLVLYHVYYKLSLKYTKRLNVRQNRCLSWFLP